MQSSKTQTILATYPTSIQKIVKKLQTIIKEISPESTEKVYPGWRAIGYTHPQKGYFCAIFPSDTHVKLGFEYGAFLPDPHQLLKVGPSQGHRVRYLEIHTLQEIRVGQIKSFLNAALAFQK
jgi:hypothetical protein